MNLAKIEREDDCIYMLQDIGGLKGYERAKAIVNFCDKEIKQFEKEIDRAIYEIFERNDINVPSTKKSALKPLFDTLKAKGIDIVIGDTNPFMYRCTKIKEDKWFTIYLEDDRYLQVSVRVREIKL